MEGVQRTVPTWTVVEGGACVSFQPLVPLAVKGSGTRRAPCTAFRKVPTMYWSTNKSALTNENPCVPETAADTGNMPALGSVEGV